MIQQPQFAGRADVPANPIVSKTIDVSGRPPTALMIVIRFGNLSPEDIFVLRDPPRVFVKDEAGRDVRYIGQSEKRRPYTLDDYERVPPRGTTERRANLASAYDWRHGTHTYELSISGGYVDPVSRRTWEAPRVKVRVAWTR